MTKSAAEKTKGTAIILLVPVAMSVAMLVLGWRKTETWGGRPAVEAMLVAQIILLTVVYASILPIVRKLSGADGLVQLKLAFRAGGMRFLLTLAAVAVVLFGGWVERRPFLIWVGIGYVVMTLAETVALARWLNKTGSSA